MTTKNPTYSDFLKDKNFIYWCLTQSEELDEYWQLYIRENPIHVDELNKAKNIFEKGQINKNTFEGNDILYKEILSSIESSQLRTKRKRLFYISTAAAVGIILLISSLFYFNSSESNEILAEESIIGKTLPAENVQLISGGKTIILGQNTDIQLTDDGQVAYVDSTNNVRAVDSENNILNKLIVPNGKRSFLTLSDGTKVWVNSGTELEFPSVFSEKSRNIKVTGEIFLEVAELKTKPFIVETPNFNVKVYGTSFNVSAYKDNEETSVVLVNGSVQVKTGEKSLMMSPNEIVKLKHSNLTKEKVDVALHTSWKDGYFEFNKTPIHEVLKKTGRYYNISFDPNAQIENHLVTGKLYLSNDINNVITSLSVLTSMEFIKDGNKIKIMKK